MCYSSFFAVQNGQNPTNAIKEKKPGTILLRRFTIDDSQAMFENWASDERVTQYLTWCPHESPEATKQLLALWCAAYEKPNTYNWVIEHEGTPIGNISVVRLSEKCEYAELGYCMGYAYWNKGLMSEAVKAVIDHLFAGISAYIVPLLLADSWL